MALQDDNEVLFNPQTYRIRYIAAETVGQDNPLEVVILIGAPPARGLGEKLAIDATVENLADWNNTRIAQGEPSAADIDKRGKL